MKQVPIFFIAAIIAASCSQREETTHVAVKKLTEAVYASGYVVSANEYEVISQAEGYVLDKLIDDGGEVKKGDPVYILENGQQSSRFELARKQFGIASRNLSENSPVLNELRSALQGSRSKTEFDSINYVRYSNLLAKNAISKIEFDRIKLSYDNSRNDYMVQQSRFTKMKDQLVLEYENARSQLAITANESGKYMVRSEVNGKVFRTLKERGELVRRSEVIAVIGNDSAYYLELSVDELDIQRVKKGQAVLISVDAYPEKMYKGTVARVYPMVNRQQQSVQVDVFLDERLPGSYSGLSVEANIIIREKDNALVLPVSALLGKDSLLIMAPGGEKKIKVRTGLRTLEEVEIVEGIDSSAQVIIRDR